MDIAHAAVAVITGIVLLAAIAARHPGYAFPFGIGTGRDRHYPKTALFDEQGNPLSI